MITVRKSEARGHMDHGWLDARHTFSFGHYHDPEHEGFRQLRVINEDRVAPGTGFGEHGHRDMEIVTYVLSGALEHKDNMGNGSVLRHGDVQRMSAGRGVRHSEFNHSSTEPVHLLQIWILPERQGLDAGYEDKHIGVEATRNRLKLIASPSGAEESLKIFQDVRIYASNLETSKKVKVELSADRHGWIQVAHGEVHVNGVVLKAGDGASVSDEHALDITAVQDSEFLVFDLN